MRMNAAEKRIASRWIPNGSTELQAPEIDAVVYLYDMPDGRACAVAYSGTAGKHKFNNAYRSEESRLRCVNEWRASMAKHLNWKVEHKTLWDVYYWRNELRARVPVRRG